MELWLLTKPYARVHRCLPHHELLAVLDRPSWLSSGHVLLHECNLLNGAIGPRAWSDE